MLTTGAARDIVHDDGDQADGPGGAQRWALECRGLSKRFGRNRVLDGIDVGIPHGLITAVLGPSGTGKSVLLKHLVGLVEPDRGQVLVDGEPIGGMSLAQLLALRRRFGILFQDGALWSSLNLYDNVAFPLRQHTDLAEREIADVVRDALRAVGLADAGRRMPAQLSGGMRKRAGLARALVLDPEFVFFDEPDSGLDPVRTALLSDLIATIHRQRGGTYVVITHDVALAGRIAEYLVILWHGKIVEAGPKEQVLASSQPFVRQFLAGATEGPLGMG